MIERNLSVIKQQVGQLDRLVNDLASESNSMGGALSLDLQGVDLAQLARDAAERYKVSYPDRPMELAIAEAAPVKGDPTRLNQVIDNLVNNAAKYSPPDRPIRLSVEMADGQAVLAVQDQGFGIDEEHLSHLFERFYRVPNASTEHVKGLGLGLSIVNDLIAAHGGRVWAESTGAGHGSTFRVSLPCVVIEPQPGSRGPQFTAPVRLEPRLQDEVHQAD
jgi:signal transduction histidine kinase